VLLQDAFARWGSHAGVVTAGEPTAEQAAAATERLLAADAPPDVIIAFNDVMALGVLSACRRAGVDVPGEVRVVGVDGLPLGALVTPTLTTLEVDVDEVARQALELAVGMVTSRVPRSGADAERTVRHRLVLRESA
jgi:DNA-binding LacI/PurR family transcriptional regulator